MKKYVFSAEDIIYLFREDNKTYIRLLDGRTVTALIPIGHFEDNLPKNDFLRINKSVLVCAKQVVNVNQGFYLMTDGASLEGRHHGAKCHTDFMRRMIAEQSLSAEDEKSVSMQNNYAAYDNFPLPFCVIQLVFDIYGKGTTFIFRYCNKMMEFLEGKTLDKLVNRSFYDVFENLDGDWLVKYGDVARNGGRKIFREYKPAMKKYLSVLCYQISPGFCGCLLLEDGWADGFELVE